MTEPNLLVEVGKIFLTAALSVALSGFWVSRWKASTDHAEKRIDDLCSDIGKLADLGSDYWLTAQSDTKIPVLQARIGSGLVRIAAMRVGLSSIVRGLSDNQLVELEANFARVLTGGDFGVHNRATSVQTASAVQHVASALIVEIRKGRIAALEKQWYLPKI